MLISMLLTSLLSGIAFLM
ncbi:hypothetical protein M4D76_02755 [Peribacillus frigoritolerans]|nr:hypothetical protein [Peribacillus frigoritolerans]MCM3167673.1 hypothetical protein [Peribacillus frigoritolerans]MCP1097008.1 hypothetical protein [Bacillaceae bacterium OS4b]MCP1153962.1 hypothetical protein [Peribacillus frigoritolerans]MCT1387200.1 hypothetical protein [Peribacillus frigoritolerans]